jgi:hypothetical protein
MAIDGHIYKTKEIVPLIQSLSFRYVNDLEARMNANRFRMRPLMVSLNKTIVYNVQNNFVKPENNPNDAPERYSVEWLNDEFLAGKRIQTDKIYGFEPRGAHGPIEYVLS